MVVIQQNILFLNLLTATKRRQFCLFFCTGEDFHFRRSLELWMAQVQRPWWKIRRLQGLKQRITIPVAPRHVHYSCALWCITPLWERRALLISPGLLLPSRMTETAVPALSIPFPISDQACHTKDVHSASVSRNGQDQKLLDHVY